MSGSTKGRSSRSVLMIACLFLLGTSAVLADTLWTKTYGSPSGGDDGVCSVLSDTFNNTVVVGWSAGASGAGGSDFVILKYSWFHGNTMWTKLITGDSTDDVARDAAIEATGTVVATGQTGRDPNYDILTVQLDPNGNEDWRATYAGSGSGGDVGTAITTDTAGGVYVAGYAQNTSVDFVTIKYNWDGSRAWAQTYDAGGEDKPVAIALGPDGSVYVTGKGGSDYLTVKYSATGVRKWVKSYNAPYGQTDWATALAVDSDGNAYVTGTARTASGPTGENNFATVKYDTAGTQLWAKTYARNGSEPTGLALGPSALYITGQTRSATGPDADFVTVAYDYATGDTLWARRETSVTGGGDYAVGVAVGTDSSIWVTGTSNYDIKTVLYSPDGVQHWVQMWESGSADEAAAIVLDRNNKVVVSGYMWAGSGYDIQTVKFDTLPLAVSEPRHGGKLSGIRLAVAPNPTTSGHVTLSYGLVKAGAARVTVTGADGRVALAQSLAAGGTCPLDLRDLRAGVYVVRLESGGRAATQKLIIGQ